MGDTMRQHLLVVIPEGQDGMQKREQMPCPQGQNVRAEHILPCGEVPLAETHL